MPGRRSSEPSMSFGQPRRAKTRGLLSATLALALATTSLQPVLAQSAADALAAGFKDPPSGARPRVWWHWMNGNITQDGIAKDLAWMHRVGLGGAHAFDASLVTPQIVDERLVYMTPAWKQAFRFAAERAQAEGLELGVAGSPGWSETGGPWVAPEDGIKKVAWSDLVIDGGKRFVGALPAPPATTGPYQTIGAEGALGLAREGRPAPEVYRDIAVLAVPLGRDETGAATALAYDGGNHPLDAARLTDGAFDKQVELGAGDPGAPPSLRLVYARPTLVRSATLFMGDAWPSFSNPRFSPVLEARVDGAWSRVAELPVATVPTTVAFAPVSAREFRVRFEPFNGPPRPQQTAPAPGVVVPPFIAPDTGAHPARVAEFRLSGAARIDRAEAKAAFTLVDSYDALTTSADAADTGPAPGAVVDLTAKVTSDGRLDWTPPAGRWRVIRLGWTLTGKTNHPASPEATGLEVDKLDGEAVTRYLRHYLDMYREAAGPDLVGERGVRALMIDSTEVGTFNWTPRMIAQFKRLRGYDPTPWLPALTGVLIGTRAQSDSFLYDFRRTLSELHATEHYANIAKVAHEYGLTVYGEALEDRRPVLGDDMAMRRYADVPMGALWTWADPYGPRPTLLGDLKGASSVAHLYGQNVVAAESLTSALSPWADGPASLRRVIDLEFAQGVNRPVIHTSVHQPRDDRKPGLSLMIFGQFFNRHESWAELARPWVDYMARTGFLLQQGRNVADVAYFYGEEAPLSALHAFGPPEGLPGRYAYDFVNAEVLTDLLSVKDGDLVAPSGAHYRVLYLGPQTRRMTLPTLRRIADLARDGATIVGLAPEASPSLADDRAAFDALRKTLWSGAATTPVGKGRVIAARDVEAALAGVGVKPDLDAGGAKDLLFVHRQLADGELYYLVNRGKAPLSLDALFRVSGKAPEIWRANSGAATPASYRQDDGQTRVPVELAGEDSLFVVFRKPADAKARTIAAPVLRSVGELGGAWRVAFQPGLGAPAAITLPTLSSLSDEADPGVKYFSGEATYEKTFEVPRRLTPGAPLWLDLGAVGDLAEVTVNGKVVGTVWSAPYRLDIAAAAKPGRNTLRVKVANLWVNRLIGDAQPGAAKVAFTTIPTFKADTPLRPSGLIGPVRLLAASPARDLPAE